MQQEDPKTGVEKYDQDLLELLELPGIQEQQRKKVQAVLEQLTALQAENLRLRKTIHRLSADRKPRMSTKLKEALYE